MKEDFRSRCYNAFVSTKWQFTHSNSKKSYDFYTSTMKKRMRNIIPIDKNIRIIDIACGAGHFSYFLQHEGYINVQGIDLSDQMLEVAHTMGIKNCIKADMYSFLAEHKQEFDLIIANDIIEHLTKEETMQLLDLIFESLAPEGMVLISTINAMSLFGFGTLHNEYTHVTGFTPMSLAQVLRVCGFYKIKTRGEAPVSYNFKSAVRALLWKFITMFLRLFITIERGTGKGMWKNRIIFETRFFALAKKPEIR